MSNNSNVVSFAEHRLVGALMQRLKFAQSETQIAELNFTLKIISHPALAEVRKNALLEMIDIQNEISKWEKAA